MARIATGLAILVSLVVFSWPAADAVRGAGMGMDRPDDARCSSCLMAFRMVDDVLADEEVMKSLVSFAETTVCPSIHGGDKCRNLAEGLLPVVVQWLRAPATAWSFCHAAGACMNCQQSRVEAAVATAPAPKAVGDETMTCAMCKVAVFEVQQVVNDTELVRKINETAQKACAKLPPQLAPACSDFASKYDELLEHLIMDASPQEVCSIAGVCDAPSGAAALITRRKALQDAVQGLGSTCDMCRMAVLEAHSLVANPQVQEAMVNYTKSLCEGFPSFKDTCDLYVDTYAPMVFNLLEQALASPDTVCISIGVCSTPPLGMEDASQKLTVGRALHHQATMKRRHAAL